MAPFRLSLKSAETETFPQSNLLEKHKPEKRWKNFKTTNVTEVKFFLLSSAFFCRTICMVFGQTGSAGEHKKGKGRQTFKNIKDMPEIACFFNQGLDLIS